MKIPNTIIEEIKDSEGVTLVYKITPEDSYKLHNKVNDWTETDGDTGDEILHREFSSAPSTVPVDYDFDNITKIGDYEAYGSKEIFAIPLTEIDETNIS